MGTHGSAWRTGDPLGRCPVCGATRRLTGSMTVEQHTRKVRGRPGRLRCQGTNRRPATSAPSEGDHHAAEVSDRG